MIDVEMYLSANQIVFTKYEHNAVYTCNDTNLLHNHIDGMICKNLFLTDKKRYFLIIVTNDKYFNLQKIAKQLNCKRLSFAKIEELKELLQVESGAVSIFALLNDESRKVELVIDKTVFEYKNILFHPNRNTATLLLSNRMFIKYINLLGRQVLEIDI